MSKVNLYIVKLYSHHHHQIIYYYQSRFLIINFTTFLIISIHLLTSKCKSLKIYVHVNSNKAIITTLFQQLYLMMQTTIDNTQKEKFQMEKAIQSLYKRSQRDEARKAFCKVQNVESARAFGQSNKHEAVTGDEGTESGPCAPLVLVVVVVVVREGREEPTEAEYIARWSEQKSSAIQFPLFHRFSAL